MTDDSETLNVRVRTRLSPLWSNEPDVLSLFAPVKFWWL